MNYFIKRILNGESFKSSLNEIERKDYLVQVKKGIYPLKEAERLAIEFDTETYNLKEKALQNNNYEEDNNAYEIYNTTKYAILKQWFREQLIKGDKNGERE